MKDQRIKRWKQLKDSNLRYSFDFRPFIDAHALTLSSVTAESENTSKVTVTTTATTNGVWVGNVRAVAKGCALIELTATFTGSNIERKRKFLVEVTDPDC